MTQKKPEPAGNAVHNNTLPGFLRVRRLEKRRTGGTAMEEKGEVEKKLVALQRLVPGGESREIEKLFEETAEYILALQNQVKAMRFLGSFFQGLEKENRKLGG